MRPDGTASVIRLNRYAFLSSLQSSSPLSRAAERAANGRKGGRVEKKSAKNSLLCVKPISRVRGTGSDDWSDRQWISRLVRHWSGFSEG